MDLRSLSSTLPAQSMNSRESQYEYPPAALMSAFKQAALSVTTLYKSANSEIERARKQGYQDALDDLLHLINSDRVHDNSEVIKIREWGLSRLRKAGAGGETGARQGDPADESEDERGQPRTAPSSSPTREPEPSAEPQQQQQQQKQQQQLLQQDPCAPSDPISSPSCDSTHTSPSPPEVYHQAPREIASSFSFRSNHHLPRHVPPPPPKLPYLEDIELPDSMPDSPIFPGHGEQSLHHINHSTFSPSSHRNPSGGWKRRFPLDFLEIAAMAEKEKAAYAGKDFNGNKRGRMT